ncbi:MAG: ATP-grasp domain-containing protein [Bacteroidetes bacterium]|nr:ATP-grasp domain-containing protein [Bacteroidota bacterium]
MATQTFPHRIVLIADRIGTFVNVTLQSDNLEFTEEAYYNALYNGLRNISREVVHYDDPYSFINNITQHKNDIVFSIWSGRKSRNRRALIPSICESYHIKYVGGDTYANIICQDKAMSKEFCKKHGMASPDYYIASSKIQISDLRHLKTPLVIKPNFEGGSIGIAESNLKLSYEDACDLANELYGIYHQDIMIEEFVPGREVSIVLSGTIENIKLCEAVEIVYNDGSSGLHDRLYSYEIKKEDETNVYNKLITNDLPESVLKCAKNIFQLLGKVENLRIDGRLNDTAFSVIELSPDIFYGVDGTFACAFLETGFTYEQMLGILLENVLMTN